MLATNLVSNIDPAFMRRIDIAIDYVLPEETERRRLWEISFPAGAPLHDDVDLSDLAAQFKIAGGSIRKAALYAAFLAARTTPRYPRPDQLALEREYKSSVVFGRRLNRLRQVATRCCRPTVAQSVGTNPPRGRVTTPRPFCLPSGRSAVERREEVCEVQVAR